MRVPAAEIDLDADGTFFDELAGQQATFAEVVVSVLFEVRFFVVEAERLARRAGDETECLGVNIVMGLGGLGGAAARLQEVFFQRVEHLGPPNHVRVLRRGHILRRLAGVLHREGRVGHAEEAGTDPGRRPADSNEARQVEVLRRQLLGGHRADVRPLRQRVGRSAGA